jgi:hypothetical protein
LWCERLSAVSDQPFLVDDWAADSPDMLVLFHGFLALYRGI